MPDAFTRAVEGLKFRSLGLRYAPSRRREAIVRNVLKSYGLDEEGKPRVRLAGKILTATEEIGPYARLLREEADRQYPTGEEG